MQRPKKYRRRAVAMLMAMITVIVATVVAYSFLGSQSTSVGIARNARARAQARYIAETGLEIAINYVKKTDTWRSEKSHGTWLASYAFGGGTFKVVGHDGEDTNRDGVISTPTEGDGNLSDDPSDPLTLTVTGTMNGVSHLARAVLTRSCANATVTYQEFTEAKASGSVTQLTIPTPGGTQSGHLLIAALATDGNETLSPAGGQGWNQIHVGSQGGATLGAWWKIAGGAEPGSHQFTWGSSEEAYGWIMRFTGHDPATPINVYDTGNGSASAPTCPAVTTTVANAMILRLGGFDDDDVTIDSPGLTSHTTITMDESDSGSGSCSGGAGFQYQGTAGASGTASFALTDSEQYRTITLAIAPDPTGCAGSGGGGGSVSVQPLTPWTTGLSHTAQPGVDRVLVFSAGMEDGSNRTITSVTYGGRTMTQVVTGYASSQLDARAYLFYLKESGIAAASGSSFVVNWSSTPSETHYAARMYQYVDQTDPIRDFDVGSTSSSSPNPITTPAMTVENGDIIVSAAQCGNAETYAWNNGFSKGTEDLSSTSAHSSADRLVSGSPGTLIASATSNSPNRQVIVGLVLRVGTNSGGGGGTSVVEALTNWSTGLSHSVQGGSERLLLFTAGMEDANDRTITSASYGGQPLQLITTAGAVSSGYRARAYMYYLNEAGIAAAVNSTFSVTWSGGYDDVHYAARLYQNVDQTNPIRDSDSGSAGASSPNPITAGPTTVQDGDMAVAAAQCGNPETYSWNNGFIKGTDNAGSTSQHSTADRLITGGVSTVTASATNNNPNRQVILGASLQLSPNAGANAGGNGYTIRWVPVP